MPGVRVVSLVGDLSSGRPPVEQVPPQAPGARPVAPDAGLATEVTALAALLAEVVQLAGRAAMFPGLWEALAEQAREHDSVRREHAAQQADRPHRRRPYPAWGALTAGWIGLPGRVQLAGGPAAVESVLRGVVMLAEQAAELSDEESRTRLGGWVR
jgi:hypothetical protein